MADPCDSVLGVSESTDERGVHVVDLALRWGDMDSLGHINNVQFARLFEEARVRAMQEWFGGERRAGVGMVVAHQEIEFAAPLYYSAEPVRCEIWVSRIGGKSFDFGCRLTSADGVVGALSETTLAVLDLTAGRALEIPDDLRALLTEHLGGPVGFRRRG